MINAYEIGAKLILDDTIGKQLGSVYDQFNVIQQAIERTNNFLRDTVTILRDATGAARGLANAFQAAAVAAERIQKASNGVGGFGGGSGGGGGGGALPFSAAPPVDRSQPPGFQLPYDPQGLLTYDPAFGYRGNYGGNQLSTIPGQGRYTSGAGGNYDTAGRPTYGDPNWTPGSGGGTDASFNGGGGGMPPLYPNGRPGGGSGGGGPMHVMSSIFVAQAGYDMATGAAKALTSPSFDIQQQQNAMLVSGVSPAGTAAALKMAIKIQQQNPGISIGQAMAMMANMYTVDPHMSSVLGIAPTLGRDAFLLKQYKGGADSIDQTYELMRGGEEAGKLNLLDKRGNLDTSRLTHFMDLITRLSGASSGNITASGLVTLAAQAGPGFTQMSDTAIMRAVYAAQALTPSQVGTGLNAMYQEFIGGKMSQGTARSLHDAGVLPGYMFGTDGKILKKYRYGIGYAMLPPGALKNENQALTDPMAWSNQNLFEQYMNPDGSIKQGQEKSLETLIGSLNRDFSRLPGMRLAGTVLFNNAAYDRRFENLKTNVPSVQDMATIYSKGANEQAQGVGAALNAFLAALGSPLIPGATKGLEILTGGLNTVSDQARNHPSATGLFDQAAAVVAGWLGLKAASILPGALGRGAGTAADFVADKATGPVGILYAAMQASVAASKALTTALMNSGLDGRDIAGFGGVGPGSDIGSTPQKPLYTHVTNGVPLVSSAGPTAPNGPTAVNRATTAPNPGANNRLQGHQ